MFFKYYGEMQILGLRDFVASHVKVQQILKDFLCAERKECQKETQIYRT